MKKVLLSLAFITLLAMSAQAQLKVDQNSRVHIGPYYTSQSSVPTLSLLGPNGAYRGGAKLAFGDFGPNYLDQWNVFIGEYGDGDSDKLWMHGDQGFEITCMSYDGYNGFSDVFIKGTIRDVLKNTTKRIDVSCPMYVNGTIVLTSDARLKSNIVSIETALSKVMKLNGVAYDFDDKAKTEAMVQKMNEDNALSINAGKQEPSLSEASKEQSAKDKNRMFAAESTGKQIDTKKHDQLGFLAQDLQKVFPNLVEADENGYLGINYIGLIPVLVEAMKEQQETIDAQSLKIKELESKIENPITTPIIDYPIIDPIFREKSLQQNATNADNLTNAFLFQNAPNPFSEKTEIKYFVPENINSAILYIFDMQGATQKQITLQEKGKNAAITLHGKELKPGMYLYSLVCDGQIADTKKMILTK